MIIDEFVEVIVGPKKEYYLSKGYQIPLYKDKAGRTSVQRGTKILVKVEDLPDNSHTKVHAICDNNGCNTKTYIAYQNY